MRSVIIVLDPDSTPAGGWLPFSNALGIPGSATQFLTDLAASGGAVLFIDGIDMFDDVGRQRTIIELMRTASAIPGFRVIATARAAVDSTLPWLDEDVVKAFGNAKIVRVDALSDGEVALLVHQAPALRLLLDASHPAAALARNLYRLSRLLKSSSTADLRTEAAMADLWWKSADGAPAAEVRAGQRILSKLAETALKGDAGVDHDEDSPSRTHLLRSLTLKEVRRDRLDFYHDVLRDWAVGNYIAEDPARLSAFDLTQPASPRVARGVEFAGRLTLEAGADSAAWVQLLGRLSPPNAHGSWRRQAMLAILRSEASFDQLEKCSAGLLSQDAALLIELCTTITAADTVATVDLVEMPGGARSALPRSFRTNTTGSATLLLRWVLAHIPEVPISAIGAVAELVQVQLFLLRHVHALAARTANMLFTWLRQLDIRDAKVTIPGAGRILGEEVEARQGTVEKLRMNAALLGQFAPDQLKAYLREAAVEGDGYKAKAIRPLSKVIAPVAPAELADLVLSSLVQKPKPRGRTSGPTRRTLSFFDSDYLPPSPAQPPFLAFGAENVGQDVIDRRAVIKALLTPGLQGFQPGSHRVFIALITRPEIAPGPGEQAWPLADLTLENRLLKKSMIADGGDQE